MVEQLSLAEREIHLATLRLNHHQLIIKSVLSSLLSSQYKFYFVDSELNGPKCTMYYMLPIFSSVRSSNSHPDLLVIQHHHPLFRSHRSSTLDFHFLSYYSYIKVIKLYKGNQWTHLLAICIVYLMGTTGPHCKIVQNSAR